jgi:hypothetical protein
MQPHRGKRRPRRLEVGQYQACIVNLRLNAVKESSRMSSNDPRIKVGNGVLHYQAPELLETGAGVKRDRKINVLAFAVTVFELFQQLLQPFPRE